MNLAIVMAQQVIRDTGRFDARSCKDDPFHQARLLASKRSTRRLVYYTV